MQTIVYNSCVLCDNCCGKLWSDRVTASARHGSGWRCKNVIWISMSTPADVSSLAHSIYEDATTSLGKTINTGRRLSDREGCIIRSEEEGATPPLVAAVASAEQKLFSDICRQTSLCTTTTLGKCRWDVDVLACRFYIFEWSEVTNYFSLGIW